MKAFRYFFVVATLSQLSEPTNNDENAVEFNIFCLIHNMAATASVDEMEDATETRAYNNAWQDIQAAFAMTANQTYYEKGPQKPAANAETTSQTVNYDADWAAKKRPALVRKISRNGKSQDKYQRVDSGDVNAAMRAKFNTVWELGVTAKRDYDDHQSSKQTEETKAKEAAHRALYGEGKNVLGSGSGADEQKAFKSSYAAACKTAAGPGTTLASDMVCLCSEATTGTPATAVKRCDSTDSEFNGKNLVYGDKAQALAAYRNIAALCKKKHRTPLLTVANIDNLIHGFATRLGAQATKTQANQGYIYGKAKAISGDCAGATGEADNCVNYKSTLEAAGNTGNAIDAIPWVKSLQTARKHLQAAAKQHQLQQQAGLNLLQIAASMDVLYEEALHTETKNLQPAAAKPSPATVIEAKECDKHHASKDNCTKASCNYDDTATDGKKCKPKSEKETPAAGTGDGAAGEQKKEEKCKGKLEDACKKDTECKWENNACKDSSILVTKKFALSVVSAAFAALLF